MNKKDNITYQKNLLDYISAEDYKNFLVQHFENAETQKEHVYYFEHTLKVYGKEAFNLSYVRETIISKSLGIEKKDFCHSNNYLHYIAIWDLLPVVEDLQIDYNQAYTSTWGYDQTNVDIAYMCNKKVWGLDVVVIITNRNEIMLVRSKQDYYAFSDKKKIRNFHIDLDPTKTFKQDASVTGYYR